MLRSPLLTFVTLLFLSAAVGSLFMVGGSWIAFAIIEVSAILLCMEVLVRNIPSSIQTTIEKNCLRYDGTVSTRRKNKELRIVGQLKRDTAWVLAMVVLPSTFLVWIVDKEVVPLSLGFNAISDVSPSTDQWKGNIADEERQFDRWKTDTSAGVDTETHKRLLRDFWPLALILGVAWIGICCLLVQSTYLRMLADILSKARYRSQQYRFRDLGLEDEQQFHRKVSRESTSAEILR